MKILTWQARTNKDLTLKNLASITGLSKSTLNNIENERVSPTLRELEIIALALNLKITDLFDADNK